MAVAGFGQQAEDVSAELEVPLYADFNDLLKEIPLDAVAIALPNGLHVSSTRACLDAGVKNILLEKPIVQRSRCDAAHWPSSSFFVKVSFSARFYRIGQAW